MKSYKKKFKNYNKIKKIHKKSIKLKLNHMKQKFQNCNKN